MELAPEPELDVEPPSSIFQYSRAADRAHGLEIRSRDIRFIRQTAEACVRLVVRATKTVSLSVDSRGKSLITRAFILPPPHVLYVASGSPTDHAS